MLNSHSINDLQLAIVGQDPVTPQEETSLPDFSRNYAQKSPVRPKKSKLKLSRLTARMIYLAFFILFAAANGGLFWCWLHLAAVRAFLHASLGF